MMRILVFGVSGSGKTLACRGYAAKHADVVHVSASDLLRRATEMDTDAMRTAPPAEIMDNQTLLADELDAFLRGRRGDLAIIDAHSVIDSDPDPITIPTEVVASLRPSGMIYLEVSAPELLRRRSSDTRLRPSRSLDRLASLTNAAREAVLRYNADLRVPLLIVDAEADVSLEPAIADLVSKNRSRPA